MSYGQAIFGHAPPTLTHTGQKTMVGVLVFECVCPVGGVCISLLLACRQMAPGSVGPVGDAW